MFLPYLIVRLNCIPARVSFFAFLCVSGRMCTCRLTCSFLNILSRTISVKFAKNSLVIGRFVFLRGGEGVLFDDFIVILGMGIKGKKEAGSIPSSTIFVLARLFLNLVGRVRRSRHCLFRKLFLNVQLFTLFPGVTVLRLEFYVGDLGHHYLNKISQLKIFIMRNQQNILSLKRRYFDYQKLLKKQSLNHNSQIQSFIFFQLFCSQNFREQFTITFCFSFIDRF